jgi:hypothetical protein
LVEPPVEELGPALVLPPEVEDALAEVVVLEVAPAVLEALDVLVDEAEAAVVAEPVVVAPADVEAAPPLEPVDALPPASGLTQMPCTHDAPAGQSPVCTQL